MSDRQKSNSGIGLDLLANQTKTRKTSGNGFGNNQNIDLNDVKVEDLGNDYDEYKFKVDDDLNLQTNIDDSKIDDLEKLNNYHNTFASSPKKSSPLFRTSAPSAPTRDTREPRYSTHSLDPIKSNVFDDKYNGFDHRETRADAMESGHLGGYGSEDNYRRKSSASNGGDELSYGYKPHMTEREVRRAKREVYRKLQKLKDKGIRIPHFTEDSDLDEMNDYFKETSKDLRQRAGVRTLRNVLTTGASVLEFGLGVWNPLNFELNGWSESVRENITDFDEVFEEFAEKYFKDKSKWPVEVRLAGLILWSAVSFHFTNVMAKRMANGGSVMGMTPQNISNMMNMFTGGGSNQQQQTRSSSPPRGSAAQERMRRPSGRFNSGPESQSVPRSGGQRIPVREMSGPQGVDDIVNELKAELNDDDFSVTSETSRNLKERKREPVRLHF